MCLCDQDLSILQWCGHKKKNKKKNKNNNQIRQARKGTKSGYKNGAKCGRDAWQRENGKAKVTNSMGKMREGRFNYNVQSRKWVIGNG